MAYDYKNYAKDLNDFVDKMSADEQQAVATKKKDDVIFLHELGCIKAIANAWNIVARAKTGLELMALGKQLAEAYSNNKFSTRNSYPAVIGPRTLKLAEHYLALLNKAHSIESPQIGNFFTQPLINAQVAGEKIEVERTIRFLSTVIYDYKHSHLKTSSSKNQKAKKNISM